MKVELKEKTGFKFSHCFSSWQCKVDLINKNQIQVSLVDDNIETPAKLIYLVKNIRDENLEFNLRFYAFNSLTELNKKYNLNVKY